MKIRIGHTPDADDAFMFYAIASNKVRLDDVTVEHVIEDIETLNRMAMKNEIDVCAVSAHAYAYTNGYVVFKSGASFGLSYGPVLVAKYDANMHEINAKIDEGRCSIAVPGRLTTAYLLLELALCKRFNTVEARFDRIEDLILDGSVDLGLLIHESQLTYPSRGLVKFMDLAEYWSRASNGLPLPLGLDVGSISLGYTMLARISAMLKESILYAYEHFDDALDYAMHYARGKDRSTIARFIRMYVNELTVDMGDVGYNALKMLYSRAESKGILKGKEFVLM